MATIHVNSMPIDAQAAHCVLHLEGEFAGNLDIGIAFSGDVPLDAVTSNLQMRVPGGEPQPVDVVGYDVTEGNYDITTSYGTDNPPDELEFIWKDGDVSLGVVDVEHNAKGESAAGESASESSGCGTSVLMLTAFIGTLTYLMS